MLQRGKLIHATINSVSAKSVELDTGESLEFDILICATGARNMFGEPPTSNKTIDGIKAYYHEISQEIAEAGEIVIVGGGPVGVELAGEIIDKYGESKEVTIVQAHHSLIKGTPPYPKKFVDRLAKELNKKGVKVVFNAKAENLDWKGKPYISGMTTVQLSEGLEPLKADLVLNTTGTELSSSIYPQEWQNEVRLLKVDKTFKVLNTENIYAIGDINDVKEAKMGVLAMMQATLLAKNLAKKLKGRKLKEYSVHGPLMVVPIGRAGGYTTLGGIVLGNFMTSNAKGKGLFIKPSWKLMSAKETKN